MHFSAGNGRSVINYSQDSPESAEPYGFAMNFFTARRYRAAGLNQWN
jgi:hypothetical protein